MVRLVECHDPDRDQEVLACYRVYFDERTGSHCWKLVKRTGTTPA